MIATYRVEPPRPGGVASSALARIDGTLAEKGGCLVIAGAGGAAVQPVFPEGKARWDAAAGSLVLGGRTYRLGSPITVGGGGVGDEAAFAAKAGVTIPPCAGASLFIVSL